MIVLLKSETGGVFRLPVSSGVASGIGKIFKQNGEFYTISGIVASGEIVFQRGQVVKTPGHYVLIVYALEDEEKMYADSVNDLVIVLG